MHSVINVADYILNKAGEAGKPLTPMQVLKLAYLCHGWMLGIHHRPLIKESVGAWQYGPVIPELYAAIKTYRSSPVKYPISKSGYNSFEPEETDIMDQVVDIYSQYSGIQLSRLTHAPGTPWHQTWHNNDCHSTISNDLIQEHFTELATSE